MKSISFVLALCFLMTSCMSYRPVSSPLSTLEKDKKYKVVTSDKEKIKGRLKMVSSDSILLKKGKRTVPIALDQIEQIERGKFSILKTVGFYVFLLGVGILLYTTGPGIQIP